ncbi:MAG: hypothetical protein A2931_04415 [Candidatus Niyogibacteria bacterium RIFCSPLOWO2_01_FULL_45_48]|uniref:Uncharacterized protein n=2 Tax=Candidatus Niyogiibacteriota TaxID=1817912 RepID=A0A1G2EY98_9BACT|nr:MAG: hypothetical protein A2931_04415 [Candidatus Niyogibacteria bacterium RIFCSPLOWO2_01_FULL_45_48]OGZ30228.1 MAG: hypothetical protein A3J00_01020 [Candidatus Niyogibacteria bacterium RIFCSPLOWO2_02_FULL_45_13]
MFLLKQKHLTFLGVCWICFTEYVNMCVDILLPCSRTFLYFVDKNSVFDTLKTEAGGGLEKKGGEE